MLRIRTIATYPGFAAGFAAGLLLAAGFAAGFAVSGLLDRRVTLQLPETKLYATASNSTDGFVAATGLMDENVEALFLLDSVTGELRCTALNPRGELYTPENIRQRLNMRDFMDTLRSSGIDTGGPAVFSQAERQAFANQLDRWLAQRGKRDG